MPSSAVLWRSTLLATLALALAPVGTVAAAGAGAGSAATPLGPRASPTGGERTAIENRLQKSVTGVTAADGAALGPPALPILFAIVDDRAAVTSLRARAVDVVGFIRVAAAHAFLENLITRMVPGRDPIDLLLLRRAAVALGWQSGPRVVDTLAPLLDHDEADVRLDAAVALGLSRLHAAEKPLRVRLTRESDPEVRKQLTAQLRSLQR
jgi:HEAT repeat protein